MLICILLKCNEGLSTLMSVVKIKLPLAASGGSRKCNMVLLFILTGVHMIVHWFGVELKFCV